MEQNIKKIICKALILCGIILTVFFSYSVLADSAVLLLTGNGPGAGVAGDGGDFAMSVNGVYVGYGACLNHGAEPAASKGDVRYGYAQYQVADGCRITSGSGSIDYNSNISAIMHQIAATSPCYNPAANDYWWAAYYFDWAFHNTVRALFSQLELGSVTTAGDTITIDINQAFNSIKGHSFDVVKINGSETETIGAVSNISSSSKLQSELGDIFEENEDLSKAYVKIGVFQFLMNEGAVPQCNITVSTNSGTITSSCKLNLGNGTSVYSFPTSSNIRSYGEKGFYILVPVNENTSYIDIGGSVTYKLEYDDTNEIYEDNPLTSVNPDEDQYAKYDNVSISIVKRSGEAIASVENTNEMVALYDQVQNLGLNDTLDESNVYFQIGTYYWNIQTGTPISHNIQIIDQMGADISERCFFKDESGQWIKIPSQNDVEGIKQITNKTVYLMVPYDGFIRQVQIKGTISYKLYYEQNIAVQTWFNDKYQEAGYGWSNGVKEATIRYHVDSDVWKLTGDKIKIVKINKQAKENYGVEIPIAGVSFKFKNTIRENYATNPERCWLSVNQGGYYCNDTESEATVFTTDENGEINLSDIIIGQYTMIEVGNINSGYDANAVQDIMVGQGCDIQIPVEDTQLWIAIYGKVWEDDADQEKTSAKDGLLNEEQDKLLDNVIVRLKLDGVPLEDKEDFILQPKIDNVGEYTILSDLVSGYPDYDPEKGVTVKNTILTGNEDYKFFDVRYSDKLAEYRTGPGEFGFIGLDIDALLAGRYSVEFEYDGIIYKEVDAGEFVTTNHPTTAAETANNTQNIKNWQDISNTSKAYEYQSVTGYPVRGRDEFNEEFSNVKGVVNEDGTSDSYLEKTSEFVNAKNEDKPYTEVEDEKLMTYSTQRWNSESEIQFTAGTEDEQNPDQNEYIDYSYFENTLEDNRYNIVADTINYELNFEDLFIFHNTQWIDYVNLGLYRRSMASVETSSDLVQVKMDVNGYSHIYNYDQEREDPSSLYNNSMGVKFHKTRAKGYRSTIYTADAKYQNLSGEVDNNILRVYVTYVLKIENTSTDGIDIGINEVLSYHNKDLSLNEYGFDLDKETGKVTNTENGLTVITTEQTKVPSDLQDENDKFEFAIDKISISSENNIIHTHGEEQIENSMPLPTDQATVMANAPGTEDCSTEIYIKYELSAERIKEIAKENSPQDEYLCQIFEISNYTLYKQEKESTKEKGEFTGSYYKYAGVIDNSNPDNVDARVNKHKVVYYEDDTAYAPLMKLEFNGERGIGGIVFEDNSEVEKDSKYSSFTTKDGETTNPKIETLINDNISKRIYNDTSIFANDQLNPFNLRNGNGTMESSELGIGDVQVQMRAVDSYYNTETLETVSDSSGGQKRITVNYRTSTVSKAGSYGYKILLVNRAKDLSSAEATAVNYSDVIEDNKVEEKVEEVGLGFLDLSGVKIEGTTKLNQPTLEDQLTERLEQLKKEQDEVELELESLDILLGEDAGKYLYENNLEIYFKPVYLTDEEAENATREYSSNATDSKYFYIKKDMKKGEYYFPDVIPNYYKMNFVWGGQDRLENMQTQNSNIKALNNITNYTTSQFKSTIVDNNFDSEYSSGEEINKSWYAFDVDADGNTIKTTTEIKNDATDSLGLRDLIDKRTGISLDSTSQTTTGDVLRDTLVYGDNIMSSYSQVFELKVEDGDIIQETNTVQKQETAETGNVTEYEEYRKAVVLNLHSDYDIKPIDFGITLRAQSGVEVFKTPSHIKLTLANGTVLVDQDIYSLDDNSNSEISNMVMIPGSTEANRKIQLIVDEQNRLNSTLEITYSNEVANISEVDYYYADYYKFGTSGIPTTDDDKNNYVVKLKVNDVYDLPSVNQGELTVYDSTTQQFVKADQWKGITKEEYKNEKAPINGNEVTSVDADVYDASRFVHADEIKQSQTTTGYGLVTNTTTNTEENKLKWEYLDTNNTSTTSTSDENKRSEDWAKTVIDSYRDGSEDLSIEDRNFYKSNTTLTEEIVPGGICSRLLKFTTLLTSNTETLPYSNFFEIATAYGRAGASSAGVATGGTGNMVSVNGTSATVAGTSSTGFSTTSSSYYGTPIKYNSSTFKAAARKIEVIPPTGANKNYTPYVLAGVSTLLVIGIGLVIVMIANKNKAMVVVEEGKGKK